MSKIINIDDEYKEWLQDVSRRFKRSQIKAAIKVNDEMLRFYWSLGKDISEKNMEAKYGSGFYKTLSHDLMEMLPDVRSLSVTNLKYMRYFYETFPGAQNRQQAVDDSGSLTHPQPGDDSDRSKRPQVVDDLEIIFYIPWGHYRYILNKCRDNPDKALFYVRKTLENGWSRAVLLNFLDTDLYERQGKAVTNFALTLPENDSNLAQEITKDP